MKEGRKKGGGREGGGREGRECGGGVEGGEEGGKGRDRTSRDVEGQVHEAVGLGPHVVLRQAQVVRRLPHPPPSPATII